VIVRSHGGNSVTPVKSRRTMTRGCWKATLLDETPSTFARDVTRDHQKRPIVRGEQKVTLDRGSRSVHDRSQPEATRVTELDRGVSMRAARRRTFSLRCVRFVTAVCQQPQTAGDAAGGGHFSLALPWLITSPTARDSFDSGGGPTKPPNASIACVAARLTLCRNASTKWPSSRFELELSRGNIRAGLAWSESRLV
jgi:hypothetical protein